MARREITANSPEELHKSYPIEGRLPNWYFRLTETSNSAWKAEGCDIWGRKVTRDGADPEEVLEACVNDAKEIGTCPTCEEYDIELDIHGPSQLRRIVGKLQTAVREEKLIAVEEAGGSADRPSFLELDLDSILPDALEYEVECSECGRKFRLRCETYHGAGGQWGRA